METITILHDDMLEKWDDFVTSHDMGTVYHTSFWRKTIQSSYGHKPVYLVMTDENNIITAGIPFFGINGMFGKKLSCLPSAQYANPLLNKQQDYEVFEKFIIEYLKENNVKSCELKTSGAFYSQANSRNKILTGYCTHILSLDKPQENIFQTFHKNCVQRPIRKSEKIGLKLIEGSSASDVKRFYKLYLKMRKKNGLLPQPFCFFMSLWNNFKKNNMIDILHAEYKGKIISSILLLKFKKTVIYEYGATLPGFVNLHPSHFLLWEAIKRSKSERYDIFDFGRTSEDNANLLLFKSRWGTKRLDLFYQYIPKIDGVSRIRQVDMIKSLMNIMIRIMPDPVCRVMGKILYRNIV
jgi:hypothetical protein